MKKIFSVIVAVMIVVISVVPAFAYEYGSYGNAPDFTDEMINAFDNYQYAVFLKDGNFRRLYLTNERLYFDSANRVLVNNSGTTMTPVQYLLDGQTWVLNTSSTKASIPFDSLYWANYDIYYKGQSVKYLIGDTTFLRPSLEEEILEVTLETLEGETVPEVNRVMMVLTIVGVGCLALLTVLNLFGKKSLIYRS